MSVLNTMSTILLIWTVITTNTRTQADTDTGRELYDSSERGDLAQVRQLLGNDCTDVNKLIEQPRDWDRAALHAAVNHTKVVMYLLSCGADPNIHGDKGQTPLYLASGLGLMGAVRVLLGAGADPNYKDTNINLGWTSLIIAAGNGHYKTMKALISAGADIDLQNLAGNTALMLASEYNHLYAVRTLIRAGANVNLSTNSTFSYIQITGNTALMYATRRCNLNVVQELLSAGADIDATTSIGETALILAASHGCLYVVKELLSKGADVDLLRATGDSALMIGLENDQSDTYSNITTALIEYGVNMTIQNTFKGETALHIATKGNRIEAVKTLLKHGADTKVMTYAEQTAEDIARTNDFTDILKLIQQSTVCNNLYQ